MTLNTRLLLVHTLYRGVRKVYRLVSYKYNIE